MLPLPPPPPLPLTPPSRKQTVSLPSPQNVIPKQTMTQQPLTQGVPYSSKKKAKEYPIIRQTHRTNPVIWCGAILCLIFSILLIFFGIATLIIFLQIKPRDPLFDTPNANLNFIYLNSLEFMNGDFVFLANFSNPNQKLDVKFEDLEIELYFSDSLIATQVLQPFTQRRGETRLVAIHLISSLVYLPPNLALQLQKQVQSNKVIYNLRGTFRARFNLGILHFSYWLHTRCQLELTGPPTGLLVSHSCRTKR